MRRAKIRCRRGDRLLRGLVVWKFGHHPILWILGVLKSGEEGWVDVVHVHVHWHVVHGHVVRIHRHGWVHGHTHVVAGIHGHVCTVQLGDVGVGVHGHSEGHVRGGRSLGELVVT